MAPNYKIALVQFQPKVCGDVGGYLTAEVRIGNLRDIIKPLSVVFTQPNLFLITMRELYHQTTYSKTTDLQLCNLHTTWPLTRWKQF